MPQAIPQLRLAVGRAPRSRGLNMPDVSSLDCVEPLRGPSIQRALDRDANAPGVSASWSSSISRVAAMEWRDQLFG